jgi:DNA-binding NarL/FixJ family response regulator
VADLLARRPPALVLERIARGGGATRWFLLRKLDDLSRLCDELQPGSSVSVYFDDRFTVGAVDDQARAAISALLPEIKVVLVSSSEYAGRAETARDAGAAAYVTKPRVFELLVGVVLAVARGENFIRATA